MTFNALFPANELLRYGAREASILNQYILYKYVHFLGLYTFSAQGSES